MSHAGRGPEIDSLGAFGRSLNLGGLQFPSLSSGMGNSSGKILPSSFTIVGFCD